MNEAMRRGHLRVWGVREFAPSKPDLAGVHGLIDPLVFTETRCVNEAGHIDWTSDGLGFIDYRGPTYDRVFFDSSEVTELWPAKTISKDGLITRAFEWMLRSGDAHISEKGAKPLKKTLVSTCIATFAAENVTLGFRECLSAYKRLPDRIRRGQGERKP